ncbi:uncharacterized protein LOC143148201 [Ptiloglossa arizonensis]|uniref:uncharacterized protein LOC143148201 n=1 Tax=Ptiloglossa arizonensis TaxID=3350558 RepID=UPI003FA15C54
MDTRTKKIFNYPIVLRHRRVETIGTSRTSYGTSKETNSEGRCTCRSTARKVFRLHKSHQLESRGCWITSVVTGRRQALQRSWCNVNDAASFFGPVNCCLRRKTRFRKCRDRS